MIADRHSVQGMCASQRRTPPVIGVVGRFLLQSAQTQKYAIFSSDITHDGGTITYDVRIVTHNAYAITHDARIIGYREALSRADLLR